MDGKIQFKLIEDRLLRCRSQTEKEQLKESIGILTIAFTLALSNGLVPVMNEPSILLTELPLAFAAVMTGFLLHELAHKWMAQQYGCWAEYRGNKNGFICINDVRLWFLLAAPGAVMVSGNITNRQHGIIAAVGPLTNIAIAIVAFPFYIFTANIDIWIVGELARFLIINLILAGFNMIPVQPLDGSKIIVWNKAAYFGIVEELLLWQSYWFMPTFSF